MARVKNGTIHRKRRKKVLKLAKGYFGSKHRLYRTAKEQVMHSLSYAYRDRKNKKRDFRKLWIIRINAACREEGMNYSKFINGLNKAGIKINRKMLSEIAINDNDTFKALVTASKNALEGKTVKVEPKKEVEKAPKKEVKATPKKEETKDLSKSTVAELREIAKSRELTGYSTMKKAELIEALK